MSSTKETSSPSFHETRNLIGIRLYKKDLLEPEKPLNLPESYFAQEGTDKNGDYISIKTSLPTTSTTLERHRKHQEVLEVAKTFIKANEAR